MPDILAEILNMYSACVLLLRSTVLVHAYFKDCLLVTLWNRQCDAIFN
jgi:hypothetical protein